MKCKHLVLLLSLLHITPALSESEFKTAGKDNFKPEVENAVQTERFPISADGCLTKKATEIDGKTVSIIDLLPPFKVEDGRFIPRNDCAKYWNEIFDSLFKNQLDQRVPQKTRFRSIKNAAEETMKRIALKSNGWPYSRDIKTPLQETVDQTQKLFTNTWAPYLGLRTEPDPETNLPGIHPVEIAKYMGLTSWIPKSLEHIAPKNRDKSPNYNAPDWIVSSMLIDQWNPIFQLPHPIRYVQRLNNHNRILQLADINPMLNQIYSSPFVWHVKEVSNQFMALDEGVEATRLYAGVAGSFILFNFLASLKIIQIPSTWVSKRIFQGLLRTGPKMTEWAKISTNMFLAGLPISEGYYFLSGDFSKDLESPNAKLAIIQSQGSLIAIVAFSSGLFGALDLGISKPILEAITKNGGIKKLALSLPEKIQKRMGRPMVPVGGR